MTGAFISQQAALPGRPLIDLKLNTNGTYTAYSEQLITEAISSGLIDASWIVETAPVNSNIGSPWHSYAKMFNFDVSEYVRIYDDKHGNTRYIYWGTMWHVTRSRSTSIPPHPAARGIWRNFKRKQEQAMEAYELQAHREARGNIVGTNEGPEDVGGKNAAQRRSSTQQRSAEPAPGHRALGGRCARCIRHKKGCDRARSCSRCVNDGQAAGCFDEDGPSAHAPRDGSAEDGRDEGSDGNEEDGNGDQALSSDVRRSGRATVPTRRYTTATNTQSLDR